MSQMSNWSQKITIPHTQTQTHIQKIFIQKRSKTGLRVRKQAVPVSRSEIQQVRVYSRAARYKKNVCVMKKLLSISTISLNPQTTQINTSKCERIQLISLNCDAHPCQQLCHTIPNGRANPDGSIHVYAFVSKQTQMAISLICEYMCCKNVTYLMMALNWIAIHPEGRHECLYQV